jgi:hypothetical protein
VNAHRIVRNEDVPRFTSMMIVALAVAACGKVRTDVNAPDARAKVSADATVIIDAGASRAPDGSTSVPARSDAGTPPDECVAPCLRELMRDCTAPRMATCYRDETSGALCDPNTGWSLVPYNAGMAGSGLRLAHDGTACLASASGGASPLPGVVYSGAASSVPAVRSDLDGKPMTMCGLGAMSPRYPYAGDAACAAWVTNPMNFECAKIVSGSCPPLLGSTFR